MNSPYKKTDADVPTRNARRMSGWMIGSLVLIPAALAGALYLDSLPGSSYTPPTAPRPVVESVLSARLHALETRLADLEQALPVLEQRLDELRVPASADAEISPEVEQELHSLRAEIDLLKTAAPHLAPRKDSLLVLIYRLEKAAMSGEAFTEALDALLENPDLPEALHLKLQLLQKPARRGIATTNMLTRLFAESMETYRSGAAATPAEGGTIWDQVKRNLASLITIRKVGDITGAGEASALARAEDAVAEEDMTAAIEEIAQLGDAISPYFEDWLKQARRQQKALRTIERARDLLEHTASPDSPPVSPGNV